MPLVFDYGRFRRERALEALLGRPLLGEGDHLTEFESLGGEEYGLEPTLRFNGLASSRIAGSLFDITEAELLLLDSREHADGSARLLAGLGSGREAWIYVEEHSAPLSNRRPASRRSEHGTPRGRSSRRLEIQEDVAEESVLVGDIWIQGWVLDQSLCLACDSPTIFDQVHDALFCPDCDRWLESDCGGPICESCSKRPEPPLNRKVR